MRRSGRIRCPNTRRQDCRRRGLIGDPADVDGHFRIDHAELTLDWDSQRRNLTMPVPDPVGGETGSHC